MSVPRLVIRPVVRQPNTIRVVVDDTKAVKKIKIRVAITSKTPIWNSANAPRLMESAAKLPTNV